MTVRFLFVTPLVLRASSRLGVQCTNAQSACRPRSTLNKPPGFSPTLAPTLSSNLSSTLLRRSSLLPHRHSARYLQARFPPSAPHQPPNLPMTQHHIAREMVYLAATLSSADLSPVTIAIMMEGRRRQLVRREQARQRAEEAERKLEASRKRRERSKKRAKEGKKEDD
ncbi:hypothetical protein AAT19DRAFT_10013 [Rhodotorula toruloides]|uniref:Uncharacterized protein n=1 Tax=Rhodotorula toruloides TaxID=5286 RepID=A0A2T0A1K9_RHOTO|nr:hypothetical protein AAT19DRAFT_10013 [Rhodotorula toruloides]